VFGAGLGMTMQILVTAVQNAVPHEILGSATSAVTVIRGMGNALGPAVLGAIFSAQLGHVARVDPLRTGRLPATTRTSIQDAYVHGLQRVYLIGALLAVVGVLLALRLEERPLRTTVRTRPDAVASPLAQAEGALRAALTPEERDAFTQRLAERAQLALSPETTWALARIRHYGVAGAREVAAHEGVPAEHLDAVDAELRTNGLVTGPATLTPFGESVCAAAAVAREQLLNETMTRDDPAASHVLALLGQLAANLPARDRRPQL
jgi:MFS family permease